MFLTPASIVHGRIAKVEFSFFRLVDRRARRRQTTGQIFSLVVSYSRDRF